jgi:hypothetical protein
MKQFTKKVLAIVITMVQIQSLNAQTPGFDDDVQDVPVDQGILFLTIFGIAFAAMVVKKTQKR